MVLLISLFLAGLIILAGKKYLKKYASAAYFVCGLISVAAIAAVWNNWMAEMPAAAQTLLAVFTQGGLAGALFVMVMYASAVPDGSAFQRKVMPIRGELSIMASILTLGHNIAFGKTYFARLFFEASSLRWNVLLAALCSLLMICIMLPLFITSFPRVRRKWKARNWKRLQRCAYVFYALMYVHVLLLNLTGAREGRWTSLLNVLIYNIVFLNYGCARIEKALLKRKHPDLAIAVRITGYLLFASIVFAVLVPGQSPSQSVSETAEQYTDGTYTGSAIGYNGRLSVAVTITEGTISDIRIKGHVEDEPYITRAADKVIPAILENHSTYVDTVSSATSTSEAIMEAVRNALEKAVPQE